MATQKDYRAINDFLDTIAAHCRDELTPVEPTEQFPVLLHISRDKTIKEFVPVVSPRTLKNEDRSIPRVCTAPHLFGCFVGYSSTYSDFHNEPEKKIWHGGYYIYALPFTLAIEPSKKLLPDVKDSDERWLIGYDDTHRAIKPTIVGKCFIHALHMVGTGDTRRTDFTIYLEFKESELSTGLCLDEISFDSDHSLKKGYYRIQVSDNVSPVVWNKESISITQIPKAEYERAKTVSAGLLSFEGGPSATW